MVSIVLMKVGTKAMVSLVARQYILLSRLTVIKYQELVRDTQGNTVIIKITKNCSNCAKFCN